MADVHLPATRSYNMSRIRAKDTKPELLVRKYLHENGLRYRLHVKRLSGSPDVVLPKYKTVVFIHGCFWHAHEGCRGFVVPKSRTEFWLNKLGRNVAKDLKTQADLANQGWRVLIVWECELKPLQRAATLEALISNIMGPPESLLFAA